MTTQPTKLLPYWSPTGELLGVLVDGPVFTHEINHLPPRLHEMALDLLDNSRADLRLIHDVPDGVTELTYPAAKPAVSKEALVIAVLLMVIGMVLLGTSFYSLLLPLP